MSRVEALFAMPEAVTSLVPVSSSGPAFPNLASPSALQLARDGVETSLFSVKKSLTTVHRFIAFMGLHSLLNQEHSSLQTHSYTAPVPYQHSFQANIGPALVQTFSSAAVCV